MVITAKEWARYRNRLSAINSKAAELMQKYVLEHGYEINQALLDYAYSLTTKYGEAAAELACIMYDDMAKYYSLSNGQRMDFEPAIPAETATYGETAAAVTATAKKSPTSIPDTISRLVKQAGADTTLKNALRDGAEFAWVPHGDTCAFCLMLASNGWQKASKKTIKGDHAEHIHANCDCTFAIRFDGVSNVAGYDPNKYKEMWDNAEGRTWQEKLQSMRHDSYQKYYAENKDKILEHKRIVYREKQRNLNNQDNSKKVDLDMIYTEEYRMKFRGITESATVDDSICHQSRNILKHRNGTRKEDLVLVDAETGSVIYNLNTSSADSSVSYDDEILKAIDKAHEKGRKIIAVHNHPDSLPPTLDDGVSLLTHGYDYGVVVAHDGSVYSYTSPFGVFTEEQCRTVHNNIAYQIETGGQIDEVWYNMLKDLGMTIKRR